MTGDPSKSYHKFANSEFGWFEYGGASHATYPEWPLMAESASSRKVAPMAATGNKRA